jgi:hypothetical protein
MTFPYEGHDFVSIPAPKCVGVAEFVVVEADSALSHYLPPLATNRWDAARKTPFFGRRPAGLRLSIARVDRSAARIQILNSPPSPLGSGPGDYRRLA